MKTQIAISALFTAAVFLTPAHATTTLFTASPLTISSGKICLVGATCTGTGADYITTVGAFNGLPNTSMTSPPPSTYTLAESGHSIGSVGVNNGNLGVGTSGQIPFGDYVVLDFSNAKAGNTASNLSVGFAGNIVASEPWNKTSYWVIYGYDTAGPSPSATLLADGTMPHTVPFSASNLSFYNYYAIGIMGDCAIDVTSMSVTYPSIPPQGVPEPGTFVMAGMALIGVGVTMKKRNRKA